jgi:hypothetical protein
MIDFLRANANPGDALMFFPFFAGHEEEQKLQDIFSFQIEEMPAADIERLAIHVSAPAEAACFSFFFQDYEGVLTRQA